ncbi:MAG TPA: glycosyltransferase family 1 protein [bacterium]|nr:glycosyltransferase family 1 protein [bacterium]
MRIALDGREVEAPHGIGRVLCHLLDAPAPAETERLLLVNRPPRRQWPGVTPCFLSRWHWLRLGAWLTAQRVDAFYSPYYKLPRGFGGRMTCTVHDLGFLVYPQQHYTRGRFYRRIARWRLNHALAAAAAVVAVSPFSRQELLAHTAINPAAIAVIPSGYDAGIYLPGPADPAVAARLGISGGYLLYVGNCTPHKRVELLIEAWRPDAGQLQLVIISAPDRHQQALRARYPDAGIIWASTVADNDLATLYRNAACFVFPSDYEGFGIPPVEALACGCPVVATRRAALPDTLGDAAYWADPTPAGLRAGWHEVLGNPALRTRLLAAAAPLLACYRHDVTGRQLWKVITGGN